MEGGRIQEIRTKHKIEGVETPGQDRLQSIVVTARKLADTTKTRLTNKPEIGLGEDTNPDRPQDQDQTCLGMKTRTGYQDRMKTLNNYWNKSGIRKS